MEVKDFDAIVIGTGAGGGPIIDHLVSSGFNVAAVERGDWIDDMHSFGDELQHILNRKYIPKVNTFPIEFLNTHGRVEKHERDWACHSIGGTSMAWYGHLLRLKPADFQMKTLFGAHTGAKGSTVVDWPIKLEELIPWYIQIEERMALFTPFRASNAGLEGLNPPILDHQIDKSLTPVLSRLGFNPYKTPTCLGGNTFDLKPIDPLTGIKVDEKFVHYRRNIANTYITPNIEKTNFTLFTQCIAKEILFSKGIAKGIRILSIAENRELELKAPIVIICCSSIESALLFLRSNVPNPNDLIGRNLTFLTDCTAECMIPCQRLNQESSLQHTLGTLSIDDFYFINDNSEPLLFKGGKISFSERWSEKGPISFALSRPGWGTQWKSNLNQAKENLILHLSFKGEALPLRANRIQIGRTKDFWGMNVPLTTYTLPAHDIKLARYIGTQMRKLCLELGANDSDIKINPRDYAVSGHAHQHGTLRFGEDPRTSVLNPYCESHYIKGLYALDGSFMPTSGGTNSSLTYMANSLRIANHISNNHK